MAKLNWERKRYKPKTEYQKNKPQSRSKEAILNEAISKLIVIKARRKINGEPEKRILSVQREIDKLMKMKNRLSLVDRFMEWRDKNNVK